MQETEEPQGTAVETKPGAQPPSTWREIIRGFGPGILVAMAWLGTGDLIDSAVSGANYGYALMWALALALLCRYFFVSALSKYHLCNSNGDKTVLRGFARLWRGFPLLVAVSGFLLGFTYQSYIIRGSGTALYNLSGQVGGAQWGVFVWSVLIAGVAIAMVLMGRQYRVLEWIARVAVVALILTFFTAAAIQGFDVVGLLQGLTFSLPEDQGTFSSILVAVAVIGAVGGSAANFLYPYFMQTRGWHGPGYRKVQIFDLLTGIVAVIFINVAVWVVAVEAFAGTGREISSEADLAFMMETAVGSFGPTMLWLGLFFVTFTTFPTYAFGFTKLLVDGIHSTSRTRGERYETPEEDPAFRWIQISVLLVLPLIFALPFAPNLIVLTVTGSSLAVLTAPIILVGTILLTSNKRMMLPGYANRWWQTGILLIIGAIGIWATYGVLTGLVDLVRNLGG